SLLGWIALLPVTVLVQSRFSAVQPPQAARWQLQPTVESVAKDAANTRTIQPACLPTAAAVAVAPSVACPVSPGSTAAVNQPIAVLQRTEKGDEKPPQRQSKPRTPRRSQSAASRFCAGLPPPDTNSEESRSRETSGWKSERPLQKSRS